MYSAVTHSIEVTVEPSFLEDQSVPEDNLFVWAYHIRIVNQGQETVQLRSRYWRITDAYGRIQEVSGPGVIGEQPILKPGQSFEYSSGTPLETPSGFMVGYYQMETHDGAEFCVSVPLFSLDSPHQKASIQ